MTLRWVLFACLFAGVAVSPRAQILRPADFLPLAANSQWFWDTGGSCYYGGTTPVGSRTGSILDLGTGDKEIYYFDSTGVLMLQYITDDDDLGVVTITFDTPIQMLPKGAVAGQTVTLNCGVSAYLSKTKQTIRGTMTGSVKIEQILSTLKVKAGTYGNVVKIRWQATIKGSAGTLKIDRSYWNAECVGPIKYDDQELDNSGELSSGKVGGVTIPSSTVLPNLTPSCPGGWADSLVVGQSTGTHTNETLYDRKPIRIDFTVKNVGVAAAAKAFAVVLKIDGAQVYAWTVNPSIAVGYYALWVEDFQYGPLTAGTHTVAVVADSNRALSEINENDNSYQVTIQVNHSNAAQSWWLYR